MIRNIKTKIMWKYLFIFFSPLKRIMSNNCIINLYNIKLKFRYIVKNEITCDKNLTP